MGMAGIGGSRPRAPPATPAAILPTTATSEARTPDKPRSALLRPSQKEALRAFVAAALPFGRQRLTITVREVVTAALYDREEVADVLAVDGVVQCQAGVYPGAPTVVVASSPMHALTTRLDFDADLEGLPDVSLALSPPPGGHLAKVTVHACAQAPEPGGGVGGGRDCTLSFAPPLGVFDLARYGGGSGVGARRTPVQGFYQMQMVAADQGAFLIKVRLLDGFGALASLDHCSFLLPFPLRRVVGLEGTPSTGTSSFSEHGVEWKLVTGGRGYVGKPLEASFSGKSPFAQTSKLPACFAGTVRFADRVLGRAKAGGAMAGTGGKEASTTMREDSSCSSSSSGSEDVEQGEVTAPGKVGGGQPRAPQVTKPLAAGWDDSFCWDIYDVARVSFRLSGQTASGIHVDPKLVSVHPATTRVPVDIAYEVIAGDYILFSTLGKYPSVANPFEASAPLT
eukprot:SM000114S24160  [mRNA]  locus=s114:437149:440304:+ [translate_table: standard]